MANNDAQDLSVHFKSFKRKQIPYRRILYDKGFVIKN